MDLDAVSGPQRDQNHFTDNLEHNRTDVHYAVTTTKNILLYLKANSKSHGIFSTELNNSILGVHIKK